MPRVGKTCKRVFVFGSNREGRHGVGAALEARLNHGAVYGIASGLQGASFAIVTKELRDDHPRVLLDEVRRGVESFLEYARENPEIEFDVSPIGCKLAGFTPEEIAPMFAVAWQQMANVHLPPAFVEVLSKIGTKVVLVGECNPYGGDPAYTLYPHPEGCSGWRLCVEILGMERAIYLKIFDRINLCRVVWSLGYARNTIKENRLLERRCILLGGKVASAFGIPFRPNCVHENGGTDARILMLNHPSGRCRKWNEPGTIARAREAIGRFAPDVAGLIGKC